MNKTQIKILKVASRELHREWDKTKCKSFSFGCAQCATNRLIIDFDSLIEFMDESKWHKVNFTNK